MLTYIRHQPKEWQRQQTAERADEDKPGHVCKLMGSDAQQLGQCCSEKL